MWIGVVAAIAICAAVAVVLSVIGENLPFKQREIMEGVLALIAVGGSVRLDMMAVTAQSRRSFDGTALRSRQSSIDLPPCHIVDYAECLTLRTGPHTRR